MRRAALALAVVLAALAVAWWTSQTEGARGTRPATRAHEPVDEGGRSVLAKPAPPPPEAAAAPSARSSAAGAPSTAEAAPEVPEPSATLRGTIVALDERGVEHRGESGRLELEVGVARREVAVFGGRWTLDLAGEARDVPIRFRACWLGRAPARLEPGETAALAREGEPELRVRWSEAPLLHVVDATDDRELDDVSLCELPAGLRGPEVDARHPGTYATLASERGSSPIRLEHDEAGEGPRRIFARSPGYAWGHVEIADGAGGEHVLRLERSGALEVELVALEYLPGLELRLLTAPDRREVLALEHDSRGSVVLDPLAAGLYGIEARDGGQLVGETEAEVVVGERAKATLELRPPSRRRVPLAGVLELPATSDGILQVGLSLRWSSGMWRSASHVQLRLDEMTASGSTYRWNAGETVSGLHRAQWHDFVAEFDVGPEGARDVRIVVPAPRRLRVWLLDAQTGEPVESEPFHSAELGTRCTSVRTHAPVTSPIVLEAPPTPLVLTTSSVEYEQATRWVEAGAEARDLVLLLRRLP